MPCRRELKLSSSSCLGQGTHSCLRDLVRALFGSCSFVLEPKATDSVQLAPFILSAQGTATRQGTLVTEAGSYSTFPSPPLGSEAKGNVDRSPWSAILCHLLSIQSALGACLELDMELSFSCQLGLFLAWHPAGTRSPSLPQDAERHGGYLFARPAVSRPQVQSSFRLAVSLLRGLVLKSLSPSLPGRRICLWDQNECIDCVLARAWLLVGTRETCSAFVLTWKWLRCRRRA